ncbi:uncharacterized protein LOC118402698 isoform X32 [Oncorhynchus keta]|uniref:uncharacterized protein LOC118402698 isoform X32 n=1 Tax=Oncorhynchus keta TaxID=8018 RepID=UPI00227D0556|nr:uncharacterized protein LOC118402698 isoform X32 [Oncorhynchus keta]
MGNVSRKTGAQVSWSHQAFAVRCSSQVIWTKVRRAMASVCVAVRVRPLNKREKEMSAKVIIHMKGKTISVDGNNKDIHKGIPGIGLTDRGRHSFSYDFSYDSTDVGSPNFVPQEKVFKDLGCDVLKAAFEGYNACVFAYGQTGSGKSYTMIGNSGDLGLIPRICDGLFCHISEMDQVDGASFRIEVSYLEIDNERVQDLLTTKTDPGSGSGLHLREHPKDGPYVENLSTRLVQNYTDIEELMHAANAKLITANTGLNDVSSRSHSIFTVIITQVRFNAVLPCETVSKIHLVDLAGSERTGARLKEGANINKSLVTLGSVISALADTCVTGEGSSHTGKMKKQLFIPYRDSLLTWLLMNSLGGNSKTIMIATISPADVHYGETLSTLRYANRAKNIVDCGLVDEDGGVKVIRELQEEISRLRGLMENNNQEETVALRNEGIRVVLDSEPPHLISIDDDLLSTGVILYHLKECRTLVGRHEAPSNQDIGSVIQLGRGTMFHFNHPKETVQLGEQRKSALLSSRSMVHLSEPTENLSKKMLFHSGMDVLAAVGLTGDTRQQRSSVVSSPLKTCTVMQADGCTVEPNTSPGVLSGLSSDGCSRRLYKAGACYSGPAETSLGAVVSHLQRGDEGGIDGGTKEGTHHAHFPLASSSSTCTQISRFDKHTASLSQTEHTASRLDRDRHRRSQAVRGLPLAALEAQFSRCIMNSSKTTVEGYGDYYKEETQAEARREEEVEQVSRVSRGEETQAGARREEEVEQVSRVFRGEEAQAGARREEEVSRVSRGEETQDESQFSASGLGALVSRVSQISGLGGKRELDSLGEEGSISGMGSVVSSEVSISGMGSVVSSEVSISGMGSVVSSEVSISGIGSVVSSEVSVRFPDTWRLLHSSLPRVLQQFWDSTGIRLPGDGGIAGSLQPGAVGGACSSWPSQVVSMVRESLVLSVVKDSQVFSLVRESHMFSCVKDSRVFSIVSELPLVQQMSTELTNYFRSIPTELTHDFRSIPTELTHDFRSIPIELTHDFRSIPIELTHDFRSIPIELTHDFRSIPIELTHDFRSIPIELTHDFRSIPIELTRDFRSIPIELTHDLSIPIELTRDFRSIPIELTHDFRSIPIELTHDFRSIPIELTHDFRSIPIELTRDFRSIPIELTRDFRSIPIELNHDLQQVESTGIQQRAAPKMNLSLLTTQNTVFSPAPSLYPAQNATEFPHRENTGKEVDWRTGEQNPIRELEWTPEGRQEAPSTSEVQITTKEELWSPEDQIKMAEDPQCVTDGSKPQSPPEQGDNARSAGPEKSSVPGQAKQWTEGVQVYYQRLVEFPGALVQLQSLPVFTLLGCLQSVVPSVFTSQRLVALYWLGVANCSQPRPHPSVVLLFESCLYALTFDPDMSDQTTPLTVFHHLPLLQIKEIQVGFGGQSLRLTASTKESVLTLYTHSQTLTQALTQNLLGVLSPGDQRVAHHPFLKEDLMALSLDWKAQVPDLLLDAGLRLSGHFHKTLADLVYILHGNMDREKPCLGEVRLLLYTTVGVTTTPDPRPDPWAQLFLTETHLGLVQENAVFHPAPRHLPLLSRQAQFQGVSLRCRSDIRCLMVGDWAGSSPAVGGDGAGDEGGAIRLDIILSRNRRTRGERWDRPREQPGRSAAAVRTVGRVAEAAILYADSNSCPSPHQQAEVWKLNFSCSSEAACLINHLSNVSMVTGQGLDRP